MEAEPTVLNALHLVVSAVDLVRHAEMGTA
jgi:hypothetical protein